MAGQGPGDLDPQHGKAPELEGLRAEQLIDVLRDGVERIKNIESTFKEMADVQRELVEGAASIDGTAAFFDSIDPDKPPKGWHKRLKERLGDQDISLMASIGYASVLLAGRDKLIAREAEAWAESPEAQAFAGLRVLISPSGGTWGREERIAYVDRGNLVTSFEDPHWISGRITKVSPENSGTIFLADGRATFRVGMSAIPSEEMEVKDYSGGRVAGIFVSQGMELLPSAEVALAAPSEIEALA
jgi:hypothetical protein